MKELEKKMWEHILQGHDISVIVYAEGDTKGFYTKGLPPEHISKFAVKCQDCREVLIESERVVLGARQKEHIPDIGECQTC